jgi:hypothetical protein
MRQLWKRHRLRYTTAVVIGAIGMVLSTTAAQATVSTFIVNPKGTLSASRTDATLTGTITCDSGDFVSIGGGVIETVGRLQHTASNFAGSVICTGSPQPWSLTVDSGISQPLVPGPANADLFAFDNTDFTQVNVSFPVRLTP